MGSFLYRRFEEVSELQKFKIEAHRANVASMSITHEDGIPKTLEDREIIVVEDSIFFALADCPVDGRTQSMPCL